jgi:prepilin peptidase CpaA
MTFTAFVSGLAVLCFAGLLFAAAVSDILRYTIPNRWCLALVLLYPAYAYNVQPPGTWLMSLAVALGFLVVGFLLYSYRTLGAGDAKLIAAAALWAGPDLALPFAVYTTLAGGIMVLFMWLQHRIAAAPSARYALMQGVDPGFAKQPMPYGAAIAVGGLYVAFTLLRVN